METEERARKSWYEREVQLHATDVRGWLKRRFPRLKDPENIVQEALVRVWRRMSGRPETGSPRALLYVTARNLALDEIRRNGVVRIDGVAEIDALPVTLDEADAADAAATKQELELLTLAIQSLPDRCRQVLTLRKIYGMPQKEIASSMGISEHTVEVQVAKGMRRCAAFLKQYGLP
jgi:RNA polymerase sigma factor (sigma-70 family)